MERGQNIFLWLHHRINLDLVHRKDYLASIGKTETDLYRVAELAERTGGVYNPEEHRGYHREAPKVCVGGGGKS